MQEANILCASCILCVWHFCFVPPPNLPLLQMLEIHERFECGIPVIIEGETGVGKTALVKMLSILWNQSLLGDWRMLRDRVLTLLKDMCYRELSGCDR